MSASRIVVLLVPYHLHSTTTTRRAKIYLRPCLYARPTRRPILNKGICYEQKMCISPNAFPSSPLLFFFFQCNIDAQSNKQWRRRRRSAHYWRNNTREEGIVKPKSGGRGGGKTTIPLFLILPLVHSTKNKKHCVIKEQIYKRDRKVALSFR